MYKLRRKFVYKANKKEEKQLPNNENLIKLKIHKIVGSFPCTNFEILKMSKHFLNKVQSCITIAPFNVILKNI